MHCPQPLLSPALSPALKLGQQTHRTAFSHPMTSIRFVQGSSARQKVIAKEAAAAPAPPHVGVRELKKLARKAKAAAAPEEGACPPGQWSEGPPQHFTLVRVVQPGVCVD